MAISVINDGTHLFDIRDVHGPIQAHGDTAEEARANLERKASESDVSLITWYSNGRGGAFGRKYTAKGIGYIASDRPIKFQTPREPFDFRHAPKGTVVRLTFTNDHKVDILFTGDKTHGSMDGILVKVLDCTVTHRAPIKAHLFVHAIAGARPTPRELFDMTAQHIEPGIYVRLDDYYNQADGRWKVGCKIASIEVREK
ncbi:MAG TPA: hypothetical protein VD907_00655 [Verrucomicrobiae bacterium]|nr:hypothetical protein [Verrucomicrobiae bacterium]